MEFLKITKQPKTYGLCAKYIPQTNRLESLRTHDLWISQRLTKATQNEKENVYCFRLYVFNLFQ